jgi:hypothetical protein
MNVNELAGETARVFQEAVNQFGALTAIIKRAAGTLAERDVLLGAREFPPDVEPAIRLLHQAVMELGAAQGECFLALQKLETALWASLPPER